jgi:hypothetical protein
MTRSLFLVAAIALAACGGSTTANNNPNNPGYQSTVNGTLSGGVAGAVTNGEVFVEKATSGSQTGALLDLVVSGAGTLTITTVGVSSPNLVTTLEFVSGTPATGTFTQSSSQICGGVVLNGNSSGASGVIEYAALSSSDCNGSTQTPTGSFNLNLTSVTPYTGGSTANASYSFYTVHGSLNATLSDLVNTGSPATTMSLTF